MDDANGKIIWVRPTTLSVDEIKDTSEKSVGFVKSGVKEETNDNGLKVIRVRETITWEMDRDYDLAYILYQGSQQFQGKKVTYLELEIERNKVNYPVDVFNKIVSTFKFTQ